MKSARALLARLSVVRDVCDARDLVTFGGLLLAGYGLWSIYPPVACVVVGAALFWLGARS